MKTFTPVEFRVMPVSPSLSTKAHPSTQVLRCEQLHPHEEPGKNQASCEAAGIRLAPLGMLNSSKADT